MYVCVHEETDWNEEQMSNETRLQITGPYMTAERAQMDMDVSEFTSTYVMKLVMEED